MALIIDFSMFVPLVTFTTIMILFLRGSYKYRDTKFLFFAFLSMIIGISLSLVAPSGLISEQAIILSSHLIGATITGWLLAFDTITDFTGEKQK